MESWQIQADVTSFETVELERLSTTEFVVEARNETARSIRFTTPIGIEDLISQQSLVKIHLRPQ